MNFSSRFCFAVRHTFTFQNGYSVTIFRGQFCVEKLYVELMTCIVMNNDILFRYLESNFCKNGNI